MAEEVVHFDAYAVSIRSLREMSRPNIKYAMKITTIIHCKQTRVYKNV